MPAWPGKKSLSGFVAAPGGPACGRVPGVGRIPWAIAIYLGIAWPLYFALRDSRETIDRYAFRIPDLSGDPFRGGWTLATAPWLNHHLDQLVYATAMFVLFGVIAERRHGWAFTAIAFYTTTIVAGLIAGAILHQVYPELTEGEEFRKAWTRTYSGASAGALGLDGVFAARSRWPLAWLAAFFTWELGLWWLYLESYTSVFHVSALLAGFLIGAWCIKPRLSVPMTARWRGRRLASGDARRHPPRH